MKESDKNHQVPMTDDGSDIDWGEVTDIVTSQATQVAWSLILELCRRKQNIGFGVLDAFLSGSELERRVSLLEAEAARNEWLRLELVDTLRLDQHGILSDEQASRLRQASTY